MTADEQAVRGGRRGIDLVQLAGWAGIAGALCWVLGDILIVGHVATIDDHPLMLQTYAEQVDMKLARWLIGVPRDHLIFGALIAVFAMPLYLIGCGHLWEGIRPAGRAWAVPAIALIGFGYATSPLPHAAFYYLGAVYQTVPDSAVAAHPPLLALAEEFRRVLAITYIPSVASSAIGLLVLSLAVARGRTAYPRWFALTCNPFLAAITIGLPQWLSGPVGDALAGAGLNTLWLLVYAQSLVFLHRRRGPLAQTISGPS